MLGQQKGIKIPAKDDYFTSTTYDTYEKAISEVQKYVTENYKGNEFAGLIEVNKDGKHFFKIKEGEKNSTTWGYALMDSTDEINYVKCDFHSHPSHKQSLENLIFENLPNATNLKITKECANKDIDGEEWCGFIYTATFDINNNGRYITYWDGSLISQNDIINSTYHPEIPSLIFSPDIDEYCIILNGQILNPIRK